jgi:biopolymer transport protein TolQ
MAPAEASKAPALDPIQLVLGASGVVLVVLALLAVASVLVWLIWFLKTAQLGRLRSAERNFELEAETAERAKDLIALAFKHKAAPGARVVLELAKRHHQRGLSSELLGAVAKRALATEQQRATSLMPTLSSIAAASPFVGLFGTVWGIMQAFLRIGVEKSASLPVVAPAIGEALIATAVGLVAAIPATIAYNYVDKRIGDLLEEVGASAEVWVEVLVSDPADGGHAAAHSREPAYGHQRR